MSKEEIGLTIEKLLSLLVLNGSYLGRHQWEGPWVALKHVEMRLRLLLHRSPCTKKDVLPTLVCFMILPNHYLEWRAKEMRSFGTLDLGFTFTIHVERSVLSSCSLLCLS
jgi:hypothetical protein